MSITLLTWVSKSKQPENVTLVFKNQKNPQPIFLECINHPNKKIKSFIIHNTK